MATIEEIVAEVDGNPQAAALALETELDADNPRTTLVNALEEIVDADNTCPDCGEPWVVAQTQVFKNRGSVTVLECGHRHG